MTLLIAVPTVVNGAVGDTFLANVKIPERGNFTLIDAEKMADAQRTQLFGACGMVRFKEKVGDVWVFKTAIGYAGSPGPDILVVEPSKPVPAFDSALEVPATSQDSLVNVARRMAMASTPPPDGPDPEVREKIAGVLAKTERVKIYYFDSLANKFTWFPVTDKEWIAELGDALAAAKYQPSSSHIFGSGPPVKFLDKDGQWLFEFEIFESVIRIGSTDYRVGPSACHAIRALLDEQRERYAFPRVKTGGSQDLADSFNE